MALRCGRACARWIAVVVGVGGLVGAALNIHQIYAAYGELRPLRWPLSVAAAVLWAAFALATFAGARWNGSLWLVAVIAGTVQVLGDYDNESYHVPLLSLAVVALLFAYYRSGDRWRTLPRARLVVLALSLTAALLAVGRMQVPPDAMNWEVVRGTRGAVEVRSFVGAPPCAPPSPATELLLDQGCDEVVPAKRTWFLIGFASGAVVLGVAAVAGAAGRKPA